MRRDWLSATSVQPYPFWGMKILKFFVKFFRNFNTNFIYLTFRASAFCFCHLLYILNFDDPNGPPKNYKYDTSTFFLETPSTLRIQCVMFSRWPKTSFFFIIFWENFDFPNFENYHKYTLFRRSFCLTLEGPILRQRTRQMYFFRIKNPSPAYIHKLSLWPTEDGIQFMVLPHLFFFFKNTLFRVISLHCKWGCLKGHFFTQKNVTRRVNWSLNANHGILPCGHKPMSLN